MSPQSKNENVHTRPSAFLHRKGRHNLLFYLCLLLIAGIFIIAAPAQAAGGDISLQLDQSSRFAPDGMVCQEHFHPAEDHDAGTGNIGVSKNPGAVL